jgi:hypothetical protein
VLNASTNVCAEIFGTNCFSPCYSERRAVNDTRTICRVPLRRSGRVQAHILIGMLNWHGFQLDRIHDVEHGCICANPRASVTTQMSDRALVFFSCRSAYRRSSIGAVIAVDSSKLTGKCPIPHLGVERTTLNGRKGQRCGYRSRHDAGHYAESGRDRYMEVVRGEHFQSH